MPATGEISIRGLVEGLPTGAKVFESAVASTAAVDHTITTNLASGDNTITVPTGATCALIVPPSSSTTTLRLKGAAGDTGVSLNRSKPMLLSFDSGVTSFILNAGAAITGVTIAFM